MTKSSEEPSEKADSSPSQGNPQMPGPASPTPRMKDLARMKELEFVGLKAGMPSWDDIIGTPHFKIGLVIDSSSTNDRHISAIPKPATPCSLASMVVLNEKMVKIESFRWSDGSKFTEWKQTNQKLMFDGDKKDSKNCWRPKLMLFTLLFPLGESTN